MKTPWTIASIRVWDVVMVLARWLLGGHFLYAGLSKVWDPVHFLKLLRQYNLSDNPWLLNSIAAALPWFEIFCGLLLLFGLAVRGSALVVLLLLAPFTFAILKRALAIQAATALSFCAVKFDCGCGLGEVFACSKLAANCLLMLLAAALLSGRGRQLCLRHGLLAA